MSNFDCSGVASDEVTVAMSKLARAMATLPRERKCDAVVAMEVRLM